jgi:hypothetical protein
MLGGGLHVDDALAAAGLEAVLVDVGAHAVAVLRDREHEAESNSQNGNPSKINPEKVARFSSPNPDRQLTSFHQQSTTNSPSKNHVLPPVFAKTPSKNEGPTTPQKILQKRPSSSRVLASSGEDDGGHFVLVFEVEDRGATNPLKLSDYGECARDVPKKPVHEVSLENQLRLMA